jgi:hypothetical protein
MILHHTHLTIKQMAATAGCSKQAIISIRLICTFVPGLYLMAVCYAGWRLAWGWSHPMQGHQSMPK